MKRVGRDEEVQQVFLLGLLEQRRTEKRSRLPPGKRQRYKYDRHECNGPKEQQQGTSLACKLPRLGRREAAQPKYQRDGDERKDCHLEQLDIGIPDEGQRATVFPEYQPASKTEYDAPNNQLRIATRLLL